MTGKILENREVAGQLKGLEFITYQNFGSVKFFFLDRFVAGRSAHSRSVSWPRLGRPGTGSGYVDVESTLTQTVSHTRVKEQREKELQLFEQNNPVRIEMKRFRSDANIETITTLQFVDLISYHTLFSSMKTSCNHAFFVVKETILNYVSKGSGVKIASLDAEIAFDKVWRDDYGFEVNTKRKSDLTILFQNIQTFNSNKEQVKFDFGYNQADIILLNTLKRPKKSLTKKL
ncbi:hypothetical protein BpHYR1_040982 [Brachionus plicatilis]|uniref:RNA-directed DNA polymerase from mobile element jockey-like n=1 Tax=Brachionus plicatilis TaxID=10195 RepID=A0A3M7R6Z2_BRAPC|nr:hypothetical protein BpHYR1_040982 [Brachionus plicatilis]